MGNALGQMGACFYIYCIFYMYAICKNTVVRCSYSHFFPVPKVSAQMNNHSQIIYKAEEAKSGLSETILP